MNCECGAVLGDTLTGGAVCMRAINPSFCKERLDPEVTARLIQLHGEATVIEERARPRLTRSWTYQEHEAILDVRAVRRVRQNGLAV